MIAWLADHYLWVKALHIISVMAWMAGMLYLPRLYVYHCAVAPESEASAMLKVMERRLLRAIINPAMIAAFVFGGILLSPAGVVDWADWWLHAKLILVVAMTAVHGFLSSWRKHFEADANRHSAKFYRVANEIPTLLMIGIIIMAVVKPT